MRARVSSHIINAALDYQAPSIMFITNRFHMEIHQALTQPKLHKHKLATPHPCFTPFKTDTIPKALPSNHPEGNRKLTGPVNPVWACRARDYTSHKHRGARGQEGVGVQDSGSAQLSPRKTAASGFQWALPLLGFTCGSHRGPLCPPDLPAPTERSRLSVTFRLISSDVKGGKKKAPSPPSRKLHF